MPVIKKTIVDQPEAQIIAKNLSALFKSRKTTEAEIAEAINIPLMTIRRLLSGETEDPRVFTLKKVADYFNVTVDTLIEINKIAAAGIIRKNKPVFVPVLDWSTAEKTQFIKDIDLSKWPEWHPISLGNHGAISENAFALESRPSMYPRFQQGTLFIIDPEVNPSDGDIVLVRLKKNNELTLRELSIDPPEWQLLPVVSSSTVLEYSREHYEIVGVVLLTLLYNKKMYG